MYFIALKNFLESQPFASDIKVVEKPDRSITGNFEVTLVELQNKLIHSNKHDQDQSDGNSGFEAIAVQIADALEKMQD